MNLSVLTLELSSIWVFEINEVVVTNVKFMVELIESQHNSYKLLRLLNLKSDRNLDIIISFTEISSAPFLQQYWCHKYSNESTNSKGYKKICDPIQALKRYRYNLYPRNSNWLFDHMIIKPCWINPGCAKTNTVCGLMVVLTGLVVDRRWHPKYLYRNINNFDEHHMDGFSCLNESGLNWTFSRLDRPVPVVWPSSFTLIDRPLWYFDPIMVFAVFSKSFVHF